MAHSPVGSGISFNTSTTSAQSAQFAVQSDTLRVVALTANAHVAIGTNPTATTADYFVPAGSSATLSLTPASINIAGLTTGTFTIVDFPEGTGCPFTVGDLITITGVTGVAGFNTTAGVVSIDSSSNSYGYFSERMTIAHDSRALTAASITGFGTAVARKTLVVAAITDAGTGKLYAQQVQLTGQA
jgi:hypothetical protein